MAYVDGFVIPVPARNLKKYRMIARRAGKIWMEYGALEYKECVLEDGRAQWGISFPKLAAARRAETVILSWITYKSKSHRNAVNKKVMADEHIKNLDPNMEVFDCRRMAYGGFKILVDAQSRATHKILHEN